MPDINISVENKIAESDGVEYICGNSDFVVKFAFDSEWDKYETKTARFSYNNSYIDVVFSGVKCAIPIISNTYFFNVGVYAGNLHTTTPARVPCKKSILCSSGSPVDPTPDVYAQLMEMLNKESGVWYPTIDDAGNMSWTRSITETEPAPINIKGADGKDGVDGHTPVKGVDYFTEADKNEIAEDAASKVNLSSYRTAEAQDVIDSGKQDKLIAGENITIAEDGVLSVDTADAVEQDNTKPVTSAAVYTEIGNIEVLLAAL